MRRTRGRPRAFHVGALAAVAVLLAVVVPASMAGASTGQAVAPSTPGPVLPLHVRLLGINLQLNVPLSLRGLLGIGANSGQSTPPSTTPPSRPGSPPPTAPTSRPHNTAPATSSNRGGAANPAGGGQVGAGATGGGTPGSSRHPSHRSTTAAPPTRSTPAPSKSTAEARGGFALTHQLSDPGAVLLISIVIATALAMAVVVRLAGRRGTHRV